MEHCSFLQEMDLFQVNNNKCHAEPCGCIPLLLSEIFSQMLHPRPGQARYHIFLKDLVCKRLGNSFMIHVMLYKRQGNLLVTRAAYGGSES